MLLPFEMKGGQPTRRNTMRDHAASDAIAQGFESAVGKGSLGMAGLSMFGGGGKPRARAGAVVGAVPDVAAKAGSGMLGPMMAYGALYDMNPRASALSARSDAQYINSGRSLDRVAGQPLSLDRKQNQRMRKHSGIPVGELIAAEYAMSLLETERRAPKHVVMEKVSSPFARVPVDTPMRETMYAHIVNRLGRVATPDGHIKASARGLYSGGFGRVGRAATGLKNSIKGVFKDGRVPSRIGFIALGLPLVAATAKGTNAAFIAGGRAVDRLREDSRFDSAFDELLLHKDAQSDLLDPISGELDQEKVGKLRKDFGVLNRYAPTVAKDPNLAGRYLETMVYQNQSHGSAAEYMRNVKEFTSLEKSLQDAAPGMNSPLLGLM